MFSFIVGVPIDPVAGALALGILFITVCIFLSIYIARRRSRQEIDNDFQLAKIKQKDYADSIEKQSQRSHEEALLRLDSNKQIEFRKIETGLLEGQVIKSSFNKKETKNE